jgi:hypothetical protein
LGGEVRAGDLQVAQDVGPVELEVVGDVAQRAAQGEAREQVEAAVGHDLREGISG